MHVVFNYYSRQGGVQAQYDVEDNTDVIFLCGEEPDLQRIPAHSWVLVDKSPVFRAMFKGPLTLYSSLPSFCQPSALPLACTSSTNTQYLLGNSSQQNTQLRQCSSGQQPSCSSGAGRLQSQPQSTQSQCLSSQRHRSSSGTSFDKYVASSLSTIQDNEDEEELLEV